MSKKFLNESKKLSRRAFIKKSAAIGLYASTLPSLLMAPSRAVGGSKEGILRIAIEPPLAINPAFVNDFAGKQNSSCIYDYLIRWWPETGLEGELARSWERSEDAKTWTFTLREGVRFHHGTEFTAETVVWNINWWINPKTAAPISSLLTNVKKVEKVGKYCIKIELEKPDPDFILVFTDYHTCMAPHDRDPETLESNPSGTGPFRMEEYVPGERAKMVRNANYWMKENGVNLPYLKEIRWIYLPDRLTQVAALQAGTADVIPRIGVAEALRLESDPQIKLISAAAANMTVIRMRSDRPPFQDNRLRLAMKYLVNRDNIIASCLGGRGLKANDHPVPPFSPWYDSAQRIRLRNVNKAKELLSQAGYGNGFKTELYVASNIQPNLNVALIFQEMVREANVNIEIKTMPRDIYLTKYWMDVDLGVTNWSNRVNPLQIFQLSYRSGAKWNESHYSNPELDRLIDGIASTINDTKRKNIYAKIQSLMAEEGPSIIPYFYNSNCAVRSNVTGYRKSPNDTDDLRKVKV